MQLIPPDREDTGGTNGQPRTMAYVFGGVYIPLSCKLVELALLKGTFSSDDIIKHLPGENFSKSKSGSVKVSTLKKNKTSDAGAQIALIYFIGGNQQKK